MEFSISSKIIVAHFSTSIFPSFRGRSTSPARSSSSESFWSRSRTFSTFVFMMSTTSSTCACVACSRFCEAICWGVLGPPTMPSVPAPAAASGAKPPSVALKKKFRRDDVACCVQCVIIIQSCVKEARCFTNVSLPWEDWYNSVASTKFNAAENNGTQWNRIIVVPWMPVYFRKGECKINKRR